MKKGGEKKEKSKPEKKEKSKPENSPLSSRKRKTWLVQISIRSLTFLDFTPDDLVENLRGEKREKILLP